MIPLSTIKNYKSYRRLQVHDQASWERQCQGGQHLELSERLDLGDQLAMGTKRLPGVGTPMLSLRRGRPTGSVSKRLVDIG